MRLSQVLLLLNCGCAAALVETRGLRPRRRHVQHRATAPDDVEVLVCTGRDCLDDGSRATLRRFKRLKDAEGLSCTLGARPCMGPCGRGPNVELRVAGRPVPSPGNGVRGSARSL